MSISENILIVDDDESIRIGCMKTLDDEGYRVKVVENGQECLALMKKESFDVILLDLRMPGIDGMDVLNAIRENDPNSEVIVITGYATIDSAVDAIKKGAYDYIPKPFTPTVLCSVVRKAVDHCRQKLEEACLFLSLNEATESDEIIGRSDAIKRIVMLIKKVALTDSNVLVTGETGVGKELIAKTIHRLSARREKPFVTVDCGVLVESLFESELFGHTRGSFTGAIETTQGKFELAHGGTIFLDEIANISYAMQSRLLRVIQEKEISKVGSSKKVKVDVRIISATNRNLVNEINKGHFREDLYYRVNVFPIHIPPLRERRDDILPLAQYFLKKFTANNKKPIKKFTEKALGILELYDWPGNVRELKNCVERAVVTCDGDNINTYDLSLVHFEETESDSITNNGSLADIEKKEIIKVLKQFNGHRSKASRYLGINRKTLREKIKRYNINL